MAIPITVTGTEKIIVTGYGVKRKGDRMYEDIKIKTRQTTVLTCVNTSKRGKNTRRSGPEKS